LILAIVVENMKAGAKKKPTRFRVGTLKIGVVGGAALWPYLRTWWVLTAEVERAEREDAVLSGESKMGPAKSVHRVMRAIQRNSMGAPSGARAARSGETGW
jgi:hypothetical protein